MEVSKFRKPQSCCPSSPPKEFSVPIPNYQFKLDHKKKAIIFVKK